MKANISMQNQYAMDQYDLCTAWLRVRPAYDDPGRTLFEEIVYREKQWEDRETALLQNIQELENRISNSN